MYFYVPMGSITLVIDDYVLTTEGIESNKRIPCLDALLGRMVELKSENDKIKPIIVESVVEPVVEPVIVE